MSVRIQSAEIERARSCHGRPGSKGKSLLGSHQGRRGGDTEQRADASLHKALWPLSFSQPSQALLGSDMDTRGAGGDAGAPLLLRFVTRFGICFSGEQDFGSTAHDSEKEMGFISAPALHNPEPCTVDWGQTDRPATWAGVGFHFAPYDLMVLNVSRSEEVPGAVHKRAQGMTGGKVLWEHC